MILKSLSEILIHLVTKLDCCVQVVFNPRELQKHSTQNHKFPIKNFLVELKQIDKCTGIICTTSVH